MKPKYSWFPRGLLVLALLVAIAPAAMANSTTVSYQGVLRDATLNPVADGAYAMVFSIWDDPAAGTKLWGDESHPAVQTTNGMFSVYLGSTAPLGTLFSQYSGLWLEISADTGAGMETYTPRAPLASVPYAQYAPQAGNAATLGGQSAPQLATPAGGIIAFGGQSAPSGWLLCDGSAVSRTTYAALFAALGTAYGAGDGSSTFNLPNLQTCVPAGRSGGDPNFGTLGAQGGARTHTLTANEMPVHTHTQNAHTHTQNPHTHGFTSTNVGWPITTPNVGKDWTGWGGGPNWVTQPAITNSTATNQNTTATNQNAGGGAAHNNLQPYLVVNFIIKY